MLGKIITKEYKPVQEIEYRYVDKEITYEEIEEIFGDDQGCLVMALLSKLKKAEQLLTEIREKETNPHAQIFEEDILKDIKLDIDEYFEE